MTSPRLLGCHVSAAGGLEKALHNAAELAINTIQLHATPPQRWNHNPVAPGAERAFLEKFPSSAVKKIFFHGIYLINLASTNAEIFERSKRSLVHALDLMARLGGNGVIFHVGSTKDHASDETGLRQASDAINDILSRSENDAMLLLEVAAGSGRIVGDRLEELAEIYDRVKTKSRVGFALDTQHLWASGYDIAGDLDGVIAQVDKVFGMAKVGAIHLNDSKTKLGSRIDRHANIGEGEIGEEALTRVLRHPKLRRVPFILETPSMKTMETAKAEVLKLRRMCELP